MVTDLDRGGQLRIMDRVYLGPTLGWIMTAVTNLLRVTAAGTTDVAFGTTLVTVNVAGLVTLQLDTSVPGPAVIASPITITDIGGNATAFDITILPYGGQLINGAASLIISANYGSVTLEPLGIGGWVEQSVVP